jgi:hypothetical protein
MMSGQTAIIKEPLPNPPPLPTVYTQVIESYHVRLITY